MKIRPFEAHLFYGDGRTDRQTDRHDESNSPVRNFANSPKNMKHKTKKTGIILLYPLVYKFLTH